MKKPFTVIAIVLLSLIALLQLLRFILGWEVTVHGVSIKGGRSWSALTSRYFPSLSSP